MLVSEVKVVMVPPRTAPASAVLARAVAGQLSGAARAVLAAQLVRHLGAVRVPARAGGR